VLRVQGLGLVVQGSGFMVYNLGFGLKAFRLYDLG